MKRDQILGFDLDDTLLDHAGAERAAQELLFSRHRDLFRRLSFEEWLSLYRAANRRAWEAYGKGEIGRAEVAERRFRVPLLESGLDGGLAPSLSEEYFAAYTRFWRLNEGAEDVLAAAAGLGVVGILTNGFAELQREKIRRFRLNRFVTFVVLSEEVGAMKPSRAFFDAGVLASGLPSTSRKVYVGDSFALDVVGAKQAGWLPILYNPAGAPLPAPALYIKRLADLGPLLE